MLCNYLFNTKIKFIDPNISYLGFLSVFFVRSAMCSVRIYWPP